MGPVGGNHERKATARDDFGPMNQNRLSREGVWDGSWKRIAAPNVSEPSIRLPGLGKCASQHNARYPTEARK